MRLVTESGLWRAGPTAAPVPLAAVLEVDGAVLSWTVDQEDSAPADHLHRPVAGGLAVADPGRGRTPGPGRSHRVAATARRRSISPVSRCAPALWTDFAGWPSATGCADGGPPACVTVSRDSTAAVLDAEIAVATAGADEFFGEDTLDSDVAALLAPHAEELRMQLLLGDPRVADLVRRCVDLADEFGVDAPGWPELAEALADGAAGAPAPGRRDDYALAAGRGGGPEPAEVDRPRRGIDGVGRRARRCVRRRGRHRRLDHRGGGGRTGGARPRRRHRPRITGRNSGHAAPQRFSCNRGAGRERPHCCAPGRRGRPARHRARSLGRRLVRHRADGRRRRRGSAGGARTGSGGSPGSGSADRNRMPTSPRSSPLSRTTEPYFASGDGGPGLALAASRRRAAIPASASNTTRCAALTVSSAWS